MKIPPSRSIAADLSHEHSLQGLNRDLPSALSVEEPEGVNGVEVLALLHQCLSLELHVQLDCGPGGEQFGDVDILVD